MKNKTYLGGADVRGGLVAADVLLTGLHCHSQALVPLHVDRDPNHPPGHLPHPLLPACKEGGVRASEADCE
tara:strand:+ start:264 stop:476 length:213 start_codon:yes stop_codon:yes gene_type:complete